MEAVQRLCTCLAAAIEQSGGAGMSNIIAFPGANKFGYTYAPKASQGT